MPTVADLRARRLELTRAALREAIVAGGLDRYRVVVESLAQEHDLMDVALAAVKLAHQAAGGDKDDDDAEHDGDAAPGIRRGSGHDRGGGDARGSAGAAEQPAGRARPQVGRAVRGSTSAPAGRAGSGRRTSSAPSPASRASGPTRSARSRSATGSRSSSCPNALMDPVLHAMRNSRINGRKVPVRRFVEKQGG